MNRRLRKIEAKKQATVEASTPFWSDEHGCMVHIVGRGLLVCMPVDRADWEQQVLKQQAELAEVENQRISKYNVRLAK